MYDYNTHHSAFVFSVYLFVFPQSALNLAPSAASFAGPACTSFAPRRPPARAPPCPMALQERKKKTRTPLFPEGKPFEFYHYRDIEEAESRSSDIGFPLFSCLWDSDGTVYLGGGGGSKGMGVRSAVVACRMIDGSAVDANLPFEALVPPAEVAAGTADIPSQPLMQAVGELSSCDEIVLSMTTTPYNYLFPAPLTSGLATRMGTTPLLTSGGGGGRHRSLLPPPSAGTAAGGSGVSRPLFTDPSAPGAGAASANSVGAGTDAGAGEGSVPTGAPLMAIGAGVCTVIFETRGTGSVCASTLPPFKPKPTDDGDDTTTTAAAAAAAPTRALSPFLSSSPFAHLASPGTALGGIGSSHRKRPLKRFAFRTDFAPRQGIQTVNAFSPDGRLYAAGGQDGVVRVFLLDDPELLYTAVTPAAPLVPLVAGAAGAAGGAGAAGASAPQTPARGSFAGPGSSGFGSGASGAAAAASARRSRLNALVAFTPRLGAAAAASPTSSAAPPPLPFVSPLFLVVAKHAGPVKVLSFSPCGRALLTAADTDPEDAVRLWRVPSVSDLKARGARIPVDYVGPDGTVAPLAPSGEGLPAGGSNNSNTGHESKDAGNALLGDDDDNDADGGYDSNGYARRGSRARAPSSADVAFTGAHDVLPLAVIVPPAGVEIRSCLYWTPPAPEHGPSGLPAGTDCFLALLNMKRTRKHNKIGPGFLCRYIVPQSLYSEQPLPPGLAAAPAKGAPALPAEAQAQRAKGVRLSAQVKVEEDDLLGQIVLSPNRQLVGIASKNLHVYTGPCPAATRAAVFAAQGCDAATAAALDGLPPFAKVCSRKDCFGLPCTGLSFDPSSRALLSVSAARGVVTLPVAGGSSGFGGSVSGGGAVGEGSRRRQKGGCCGCIFDWLCCCPVWRCCFRSNAMLFVINIVVVLLLALVVQHFASLPDVVDGAGAAGGAGAGSWT